MLLLSTKRIFGLKITPIFLCDRLNCSEVGDRCQEWQAGSGLNFINMLTISFYAQKCCGAQLLFHQQNYAQLYQYAQLEVMPNFYKVRFTPCASKISLNLLAQKPLIECWWNWHLVDVKRSIVTYVLLDDGKSSSQSICYGSSSSKTNFVRPSSHKRFWHPKLR